MRASLSLLLVLVALLSPGCAFKQLDKLMRYPSASRFALIDLADPRNPSILGVYEVRGEPVDFHVRGERVIATTDEGVWVFEIGGDGLKLAGGLEMRGISGGAVSVGDHLFIPVGPELSVVDLRDMGEERRVKVGESPIIEIDPQGERLYLLGESSFYILSIRDPLDPRPIASFQLLPISEGFALAVLERGDKSSISVLKRSSSFLPARHLRSILPLMRRRPPFDAAGWKAALSRDYVLKWHPGRRRIWVSSLRTGQAGDMDLDVAYTKYLYLTGKRKLKGRDMSEVTMIYGYGGKVVFIAQDRWGETVDVVWGPFRWIDDLAISGDLLYLLAESRALFVIDIPSWTVISRLDLPGKFKMIRVGEGKAVVY